MERPRLASNRAVERSSRLLASIGLVLAQACLVTNKVDYDQPVIPSQVIERVSPENEFVRTSRESECGPGGGEGMRVEVVVRDLNVADQLRGRIFINDEVRDDFPIPSSGEEVRAPIVRCVRNLRLFSRSCNLMELLVSSEFAGGLTRETRYPYDLAGVHWWVIGEAEDDPTASYLDCDEGLRDGGVP